MKLRLFMVGVFVLVFSAGYGQLPRYPLPGEDLYTFKARMDRYFAPLLAVNAQRMVDEEGSEYNEYMKFLAYWEPRLYPTGDFKDYFEREKSVYGAKRSRSTGGPWQEVGPYEKPLSSFGAEGTGPTEMLSFYPGAPSRMLTCSNPGGVWYSTNSGVTWRPGGTDTQIGRSGVGCVIFHPSDHQTWFASSAGNSGSGEPLWMGTTGGVFRTTDEGGGWTQIATEAMIGGIWTRILKIVINPSNASQLWAATSNGLYVTNNALVATPSWSAVGALSGKYVNDMEVRPGNSNWLYLAVSDAYNANGEPSSWHYMYSSDNGSTWQDVPAQGANVATAIRLTIEVTPADADNLYGVVVQSGGSTELEFYDFTGGTWTSVTSSAFINMGSGHSFGVDPFNPNEIFLSQGTDGRRYTYGGSPLYIDYLNSYPWNGGDYHPDIEDLVPHPTNANEVWMCHHGGISQSTDNGVTWRDRTTGIGAAQIVHMYDAETDPGYWALGLYHAASVVTNSAWYDPWAPTWRGYPPGSTCDGMLPLIDHQTPQYQWHSCQSGGWYISNDFAVTGTYNPPSSPSWNTAAALNKMDSRIQYRVGWVGGNHEIYRTFDRFSSNGVISDFTTMFNVSTVSRYILRQVFTPETSGDFLVVHVRLYYTNGTESDHLFRTRFANDPIEGNVIASWEELPVPRNSWLTNVEFDPVNPNILYIAYGSSTASSSSATGSEMVYRVDYSVPSMMTYNTCPGLVCQDLTQNLPNGGGHLAIEQGSNKGLYYVGDFGCWYSNNETRALGNGWAELGTNLPHTGYSDIVINYVANKVRVGSFGRGAWEHDLWCPSQLTATESGTYSADKYLEVQQWITSTATVSSGRDVTYRAGTYIDLQTGFQAAYGSLFHGFIHPCDVPYANGPFKLDGSGAEVEHADGGEPVRAYESVTPFGRSEPELVVFPNPTQGHFVGSLVGIPMGELWSVRVTDLTGRVVLLKEGLSGPAEFYLPESAVSGLYFVEASHAGKVYVQKVWKQ